MGSMQLSGLRKHRRLMQTVLVDPNVIGRISPESGAFPARSPCLNLVVRKQSGDRKVPYFSEGPQLPPPEDLYNAHRNSEGGGMPYYSIMYYSNICTVFLVLCTYAQRNIWRIIRRILFTSAYVWGCGKNMAKYQNV
jgi:hypothetical protein